MRELATRTLQDGQSTIVTLYLHDDGRLTIEAVNGNGVTSREADEAHALWLFHHPFADGEISYPGDPEAKATMRPLTPSEYALLEALEEVES